MDLPTAARTLAAPGSTFTVMSDNAHRSLVVARSSDGAVNFIAAECVDDPTAQWVAACLRHGAAGAADELAAPPPPPAPVQ